MRMDRTDRTEQVGQGRQNMTRHAEQDRLNQDSQNRTGRTRPAEQYR
jgi:hypothetical protein